MSFQMQNKIPKGYESGSLQQFTPEQMQLFSSLFQQVSPQSFLGKLAGGDQSQFAQMEAPAFRQFGQLQGNIASRFSGMGSGARRSSGFQNAMSGAATDLAERLQAQRMGLQQQAIRDLMGMSFQLLGQRPYEQFLTQKGPSFLETLLAGISPAVGQGIGMLGGMYGMNKFAGIGLPKQPQSQGTG